MLFLQLLSFNIFQDTCVASKQYALKYKTNSYWFYTRHKQNAHNVKVYFDFNELVLYGQRENKKRMISTFISFYVTFWFSTIEHKQKPNIRMVNATKCLYASNLNKNYVVCLIFVVNS